MKTHHTGTGTAAHSKGKRQWVSRPVTGVGINYEANYLPQVWAAGVFDGICAGAIVDFAPGMQIVPLRMPTLPQIEPPY